MLVLTRKVGEAIWLLVPGDGPPEERRFATIEIKEIRRRQMRIGIDADPDEIDILREELVADEPGHDADPTPDPGEPDTCCVCGTEAELGEHGLCASCQERTGDQIAHY